MTPVSTRATALTRGLRRSQYRLSFRRGQEGCLFRRSAPSRGNGRIFLPMILLYLDESGSLENPGEHFVVGGVAIAERDLDGFRARLQSVVRRHLSPHLWNLELHPRAMRTGSGPCGRIPRSVQAGLLAALPPAL